MHRPSTVLSLTRRLLLALLMLGMIAAPVLVAMGNTYEAAHGETTEQHDNAADAHEDGGGLLHAVAHCASCGAHTQAMPPLQSLLAPLRVPHPVVPIFEAAPARAFDILLRPPISA